MRGSRPKRVSQDGRNSQQRLVKMGSGQTPLMTSLENHPRESLMKSAGGANLRVSNALDNSRMVNNHDSTMLIESNQIA